MKHCNPFASGSALAVCTALAVLALASCVPATSAPLPTVAVLPTLAPSPTRLPPTVFVLPPSWTPTDTPAASTAPSQTAVPLPSQTAAPSATATSAPPPIPVGTLRPPAQVDAGLMTLVPETVFVDVVAARVDIPYGKTITADDLQLLAFPAASVPVNALTTLDAAVGLTAGVDVPCAAPLQSNALFARQADLPAGQSLFPAVTSCAFKPLAAPVVLVDVVVVLQTIPAGMPIPEDAVSLFPYPLAYLPPDALLTGEDAVDNVALTTLFAGQMVLRTMVGADVAGTPAADDGG